MSKAYLKGALHDATERKYTFRLCQKQQAYVEFIANLVRKLGFNAWTYKEGKTRNVYIVEFSKKILDSFEIQTRQDKIDYIRGYFDAEGSVPRKKLGFQYIYIAQKSNQELLELVSYQNILGIACGKIHVPSTKKPDYWRFYASAKSRKKFIETIGSWHPEKSQLLGNMI